MVIGVAGLQAIIAGLGDQGFSVLGPTVRGGAIVLAEVHRGRRPAGRLGRRAGRRALPAARSAATRPCSGSRPPRSPGSRCCSRPGSCSGPADRDGDGFHGRPAGADRASTPCSASAPVTCTRSASRTRCCSAAPRPTPPTRPGASRPSSSRSAAATRAVPASACPWAPGPRPDAGFDLSLTELLDERGHRFVVTAGSARGSDLLRDPAVQPRPAPVTSAAADEVIADSAARMGRVTGHRRHPRPALRQRRAPTLGRRGLALPGLHELHAGLPDLLLHLSRERVTTSPATTATSHRVWDSCFTSDFSHLPGGSVRGSTRSRYRQWMTHKLAVLDRPVRHLGLRGLRPLHHLVPGRDRHHRGSGRAARPALC